MSSSIDQLEELNAEECWSRLASAEFGRLAVSAAGEIDIFPVNFVVSDGAVYFQTAPGSKLLELTANPRVALEIDHADGQSAWSVVLKGTAEQLERSADIEAAEQLGLSPWTPAPKYRWVRIDPVGVSGRRFQR